MRRAALGGFQGAGVANMAMTPDEAFEEWRKGFSNEALLAILSHITLLRVGWDAGSNWASTQHYDDQHDMINSLTLRFLADQGGVVSIRNKAKDLLARWPQIQVNDVRDFLVELAGGEE